MVTIRIEGLTKRFGDTVALKGIRPHDPRR